MLVVATADFELYHDVVEELQDRAVPFTTVDPGTTVPPETTAVIVGPEDPQPASEDVPVVTATPGKGRQAVETALTVNTDRDGRRIIGVDPGARPGIAVLVGTTVVAAFQVPLSDAPELIREEVAEADAPLVRVGDGARLHRVQLLEELSDVPVEVVDETGTTPSLGAGARGSADILAAVNIARRAGQAVDPDRPEPTAGELTAIKEKSRRESPTNRELPDALARRVALGDLTLSEARLRHRED